MPTAQFTQAYQKSHKKFTKNNVNRVKQIDRIIARFYENANHPSFHLEKLSHSDTWTIRIDRGNRLFFIWSESGDIAIFFFVGPHDAYKTMK